MPQVVEALADLVQSGHRIPADLTSELAAFDDVRALMEIAAQLRDQGHGNLITFSKKVFIPLTKLCRNSCGYCTFAQPPRRAGSAYLSAAEVLAIARAGAKAGCKEALFTLGDKPELRYRAAREALSALGYASTLDLLAAMAELVFKEAGLLPHFNAGVMGGEDVRRLRALSVSQGIMLESASERLMLKGGPHHGAPDKAPAIRLETIKAAGEAGVPFTSGLLIGIGETRAERIEALLALRDLHDRYGHLQEIIIQNFRAKPSTRMASAPEPALEDHLWTIAVARILFGPAMNIQAPPNLAGGELSEIVAAGINDWGGVSPVTIDHVNPEAPWPELDALAQQTERTGKALAERLAIYPEYVAEPDRWLDASLRTAVRKISDADGLARSDAWIAGASQQAPILVPSNISTRSRHTGELEAILSRAQEGRELSETDIETLFAARGSDFHRVCNAADQLRSETVGSDVTYVVNRNINYTNICYFRCKFCAFSKGKLAANLRGRPYNLSLEEIADRTREAWDRGATEVCLQGGIHPDYTGETYLSICRTIKEAVPDIHIHAFSPLEISQGAATLGMPVRAFLAELKSAGLGTLPGTAAEILDDEVRKVICPDKLTTDQWLNVVETAHEIGLRTTATIMFGHVDRALHWARHLLHLRRLQVRTGGLTELVPLAFVPTETPIYLRGMARSGPTFREAVLMHAVARLALHPLVPNIQASWVKMGPEGLKWCLQAGANDVGGTLMNESITRAAGATHGEEMPPTDMESLIRSIGRQPRQRTTLYGDPPDMQKQASFVAGPLIASRAGGYANKTLAQ